MKLLSDIAGLVFVVWVTSVLYDNPYSSIIGAGIYILTTRRRP